MSEKPEALRLAEELDRDAKRELFRYLDLDKAAAELRRLHAENERLKTDAEMMQWLIDNHTAWSWNPSRYNTDVIGGFAAFSTGYLGFDLKTAIQKAMQDSALQEDKT